MVLAQKQTTYQRNRMERSEINPHIYRKLRERERLTLKNKGL